MVNKRPRNTTPFRNRLWTAYLECCDFSVHHTLILYFHQYIYLFIYLLIFINNLWQHLKNLFAMHEDAILYAVFNKVKGRQFFKNLSGLPSFGIHVITPRLWVSDISPQSNPWLVDLTENVPTSFQQTWSNCSVKPSDPVFSTDGTLISASAAPHCGVKV